MRWSLLVCIGCGRVAFDPSTDGATTPDTAASEPCWPLWETGVPAFADPEDLAGFDAPGHEHDPSLTDDGLTLYFSSNRSPTIGGDDLFFSTRATLTSAFSVPEHIQSLSSTEDDGPWSSHDGLSGVLSQNYLAGQGGFDLRTAQRTSLADPFTVADSEFVNINSVTAEYDAWQSIDGLRIYYSRNGTLELATRAVTTEPFEAGQAIANLQTGVGEFDVSLSPNEDVIVFASYRNGNGKRDVFAAIRPTRFEAFGDAVGIPVLASSTYENFDPFVSPDGCAIYVASDRDRIPGELALLVSRVVR